MEIQIGLQSMNWDLLFNRLLIFATCYSGAVISYILYLVFFRTKNDN